MVFNPNIFNVGALLIWYLILFSLIFSMGDSVLLCCIILISISLRFIFNFDKVWVFSSNKVVGGLFKGCNSGNWIIYLGKRLVIFIYLVIFQILSLNFIRWYILSRKSFFLDNIFPISNRDPEVFLNNQVFWGVVKQALYLFYISNILLYFIIPLYLRSLF